MFRFSHLRSLTPPRDTQRSARPLGQSAARLVFSTTRSGQSEINETYRSMRVAIACCVGVPLEQTSLNGVSKNIIVDRVGEEHLFPYSNCYFIYFEFLCGVGDALSVAPPWPRRRRCRLAACEWGIPKRRRTAKTW